MSKFKIGDRVRFIERKGFTAAHGSEAIVEDPAKYTSSGGPYLWVRWDDGRAGAQCNGGYFETSFELVAPKYDALKGGYYEPCSAYRACMNEQGDYVVEAVRVKEICVAVNKEEAERIAAALNKVRQDNV